MGTKRGLPLICIASRPSGFDHEWMWDRAVFLFVGCFDTDYAHFMRHLHFRVSDVWVVNLDHKWRWVILLALVASLRFVAAYRLLFERSLESRDASRPSDAFSPTIGLRCLVRAFPQKEKQKKYSSSAKWLLDLTCELLHMRGARSHVRCWPQHSCNSHAWVSLMPHND